MKYICITEVDAASKVLCTTAPMQTGPAFPNVAGWSFKWADQSTWPIALSANGTYLRAPKYFGTCSDNANVGELGVLAVYTEAEYTTLKTAEHQARQPFLSWIGNEEKMTWQAPTPYPTDGKQYIWDESTTSWVEVINA
jgi:hypothetical protein